MTAPADLSLFDRSVARLGARRVRELLRSVSVRQFAPDAPDEIANRSAADFVDSLWPLVARPSQLPPAGDWVVWAIIAGRGWGKSRVGSQFVIGTAERAGRQIAAGTLAREAAKILIVAPTSADLRDVVVEGESGILAKSPPWMVPTYEPSKRRLVWPNGPEGVLISADEADRIRGVQGIAGYGDEVATWPRLAEAFSNLRFAVRLGDRPQICATTTPRNRRELREILAAKGTVITRGRTRDNARNLAPGIVAQLEAQFGGSRIGRQELDGELLDQNENALWSLDVIDAHRVPAAPADLKRVVVAIDPAVSSRPDSDETGIVVAGTAECRCKGAADLHAFVLEDLSLKAPPDGWARTAVDAYHRRQADKIIGEANQGGDLIEATIRTVDRNVAFEKVHASRGKETRAEPIASLYAQGRVHHVSALPQLEDQLTQWSPLHDRWSPDRLDALVWALTALDLSGGSTRPAWEDIL